MTLNTKKTTITTLPITTKPDWIIELNKFFISCPSDTIKNTNNNNSTKATPFFKYQRLKTYIDLCVKLANENKNSSIYSYAIKVISNYRLGEKAKLSYIITIHQLLCMYPYLVHWVDKYVFEVFNIPDAEIGSIVGDLYATGKKRNIYEACSFAIYWYIKYNLTINIGSYADDAILSDDCIFFW